MLSSFRDRMRQLSDDMNNQGNGDRHNGRGDRRRGHGGDGGGDGDPSGPPSSSTSQAGGSRNGPKGWSSYQKAEMKEPELFKQRKTLPKLTLGPGWRTMQPALVRQIYEDWKSK
eukprot:1761720-Amphidinium_carterae.1